MKACILALEREQAAWRALDGQLPGMSSCSPALWADWLDAAAQLNVEVARFTRTQRIEPTSVAAPAQHRGSHRGIGPARS